MISKAVMNNDLCPFTFALFVDFQLWCFDHFLFVKRKGAGGGNEFSRLLRRMNIKVGDGALKTSLEKNVVSNLGLI